MKSNTPVDLRTYTGESGGTHGLDDVSKGNIYLDDVFGLPHCKYHGAMLKVAPDGIWRCGITDMFQTTKVKERSEMAISHGCYFDNIKKQSTRIFIQEAIDYKQEYQFKGDHSSRKLDIPAAEGFLILLPNNDIRKYPMLNLPIIISETEKIKVGDWWVNILNKKIQQASEYDVETIGKQASGFQANCKKVIVLPEQFPPQVVNAIGVGLIKGGDRVVVECISHIFELDPSWGGGFEIRIENGYAVFLSVKDESK